MTAVSDTLAKCRAEGRAALVGYLPACFPTPERGIAALKALVEGGVDMVEVGLPYSDPVLEGPTIAQSHDIALRAGSTTAHVLRTVEAVANTGVATVVMTYWNPIERYGVEKFAAELASTGASGLITPDLLPDGRAFAHYQPPHRETAQRTHSRLHRPHQQLPGYHRHFPRPALRCHSEHGIRHAGERWPPVHQHSRLQQ